jgi:hypothetical protein
MAKTGGGWIYTARTDHVPEFQTTRIPKRPIYLDKVYLKILLF